MAESLTPRKIFKFIKFTPTTKKYVCVICGDKVEKSDYRRKLFHGTVKTDYCVLLEQYLDITISEHSHTDTVCRKCAREVQKIDDTVKKLKGQYTATLEKLYQSHGQVSGSFKRQHVDNSSGSSKKTLFGNNDVEQDPTPILTENVHQDQTQESFSEPTNLDGIYRQLFDALIGNDLETVGKILLQFSELKNVFTHYVLTTIQREIITLAAKSTNSILRRTSLADLKSFSINALLTEWEVIAPTFYSFLQTCVTNPSNQRNKRKKDNVLLPGLVSAGAKLLSLFNQDLNLYQYFNSLILWKGGCKKSAFSRLNVTNDCFSYQAVLNIADRLGNLWDVDLLKWQEEKLTSSLIECRLLTQVDQLQQTIHLLENNAQTDADLVLQLATAEHELEMFRQNMPPGYYFVGDNVDMTTKVRNMSLLNQHKGHHMYQICAYENRLSGNHLQNETPQMKAGEAPFELLMPNEEDKEKLKEEFVFHVAHTWTNYIQHFKPYGTTLPKYLEHQYMQQTKQKTKRVNMGVLMKSEQYNEDMTDICEFVHKFVPGHDMSEDWTKKPVKALSGGDYLTFERHKQAQASKRNGRTPSKRLEGLLPKMEEFHNQGELLKVIWQLLYSTSSAKDTGTLFSARNVINARNITKDPSDHFYASSDLIEKTTIAYILTGAMKYFGMDSLDGEPTLNKYDGTIGDTTEMRDYILLHAKTYVNTYTSLDIPKLPSYGPQSNKLTCRYCGKEYKQAAALRRHEAKNHDHFDPMYCKYKTSDESSGEKPDNIQNYTKLIQTLGLIRINHNDAIHMGDGERIMRINSFLCLFYKLCGCTKYAIGILETIAQSRILLTDRMAHQLIWNRTVNHKGEFNSNHPNDLDVEHCNKVFKDQAHSYRGVFTEKTVSRVSRSAMAVHSIVKNVDKQGDVLLASGEHKAADMEHDIRTLVGQFVGSNLFESIPGRYHTAFKNVNEAPLLSLDMEKQQIWISSSLKKFAKRHFYS